MKKMLFVISAPSANFTGLYLTPLSDDEFAMATEWDGKSILDDEHPTILRLAYGIAGPYPGVLDDMARDKVPPVWLSRLLPHEIPTERGIQRDGLVRCIFDP